MIEVLAAAIAGLVYVPVLSYMTVKFAMAGYYRAKRREENKNQPTERKHE